MASYDDTAVVSGSVVSFPNGADDVPTKSLVVTIPANLDGKSSVSEKHTGRNLFDNASLFPASGSVSSYYFKQFDVSSGNIPEIHLKAGVTYTFTVDVTSTIEPFNFSVGCGNGSYSTDILTVYNKNNGRVSITFTPTTAQLNNGDIFAFRCPRYQAQNSFDYSISNVQLEFGSTAHAYEPYTTPTTYTASLGRTIYGGTADLVNGEGTEGCSSPIALNGLTWSKTTVSGHDAFYAALPNGYIGEGANPLDGVCSSYIVVPNDSSLATDQTCRFYYNSNFNFSRIIIRDDQYASYTGAQFKEAVTGNIVYELAESARTDYTFTGQEVPTRLGYNAFWSEQGDTELTYYKDGYGFTSVTVNKTGKNLFDISKVATTGTTAGISWSVSGNEITISGTATSSGWKTFVEFKLPHKGTYHFHMNATGNVGYFLRGWTQLVGKDVTEVCNDPSQVYRIAIAVTTAGQTYEGTISEIQIEVGDAYTSYEPYEAVSKTAKLHKVIYGGTADVVRGTCEPKNLLPMTNYDGGVYNPDVGRQLNLTVSQTQFEKTGGVYSVSTTSSWKTFTVLFPLASGETYHEKWTLSIESGQQGSTRAYLDEDYKVLAKYNNNSSDPITTNMIMTPPTGAKYLAITWTNRGTAVQTLNITEPQIEKGTSASDFAPHFDPFTFPPISMETDEGENTLFANEGASAITYRKETD